jgi:hypothetical protein
MIEVAFNAPSVSVPEPPFRALGAGDSSFDTENSRWVIKPLKLAGFIFSCHKEMGAGVLHISAEKKGRDQGAQFNNHRRPDNQRRTHE